MDAAAKAEIDRLVAEIEFEQKQDKSRCMAVALDLSDLPLERAIRVLRMSLEAAERVAAAREA